MQVAVRSHEVGLTYHEYFQQQLQQGVLVLGLYRLVRQQGHSFFCVMTNPLKETVIAAGDRAFVVYTSTTSRPWPDNVIGFNSSHSRH